MDSWPKGKDKILREKFGAESLVDAISKIRKNKTQTQNVTAPQSSSKPPNEDYVKIKKIMDEMSSKLKDFDLESMDQEKRKQIAMMPMRTIEEALQWKKAWEDVLDESTLEW